MIFGQFKQEIAEWFDLLEAKASRAQTVAEKVVSDKIKFLHGVFSNLEAKAVVFDLDTIKTVREVLAKVEGIDATLLKKLDVAIEHATTKAAELEKAAQEAQQPPAAPAPALVIDTTVPTPPEVTAPTAAPAPATTS